MGQPINVDGSNVVMRAPAGAENVQDMHVFRTRHSCVSCWELSAVERAEINDTGRSYRPATHCHRVIGRYAGFETWESVIGGVPETNDRRIVTIVWRGRNGRKWGFLRNRDGRWCWTPWKEYVFGGGKHAPCEPSTKSASGGRADG